MNVDFQDGEPRDQVMRELLEGNFTGEKWGMDHFMNDNRFGPEMVHPDDPSRTRLGDFRKLVEQLQYKMNKNGEKGDALEMLLMERNGRGLKRMFRKLEE